MPVTISRTAPTLRAITTKYHGPTATLGARVSASSSGDRHTIAWDYASNTFENHAAAAEALCLQMGWSGDLVAGTAGDGFVFVFDTRSAS